MLKIWNNFHCFFYDVSSIKHDSYAHRTTIARFRPGSVYLFYGKRRVINVKKHAKMFALSAWMQIAVSIQILCASHFKFAWKYAPPWIRNTWISEFFLLFYIISTQTIYFNKKLHTLSRFATLRTISNLFSFFIHPVYGLKYSIYNYSLGYLKTLILKMFMLILHMM